jgi:hypothetical protein
MNKQDKMVITELTKLLLGGSAHISLTEAVEGLPPESRGVKLPHMPYSIWQLVEHMRIAQWDMMKFCKDAKYKSPNWPDDYWPIAPDPEDDSAWNSSIQQINNDLDEFIAMMEHSDIYRIFDYGDGQSILREALQIADHNAYHIGEIVAIRRALGVWR